MGWEKNDRLDSTPGLLNPCQMLKLPTELQYLVPILELV